MSRWLHRAAWGLPLALLFLLLISEPAGAQERCLACHQLRGLVLTLPSGEKVPATVDRTAYQASAHGEVPCVDCHGDKPSPHPKTPYNNLGEYRVGLAQTCGDCHQEAEGAWEQSVHGKAVAGGQTAALCSDCHQPHGTVEPSLVALFTPTCGSCHQVVIDSYLKSVHGQAVAQGKTDAATCVDCHSRDQKAHTLQAGGEAGSPSSQKEIPLTCGRCHPKPLASYESTFHGRDWRLGVRGEEPTCIDCHGSFGIQPAHGPETSMTVDRLSSICGRCHQGTTVSFAQGWPGHEEPSPNHFPLAYYTERFLIYLTAGAMAFGILHVEMDLLRWWVNRRRGRTK